jgi:hypothetical protein
MTLEDIEFELELAGLSRDQIRKLVSFCQTNGFDAKVLDTKLKMMGYAPVFDIYDDEEEEDQKKS